MATRNCNRRLPNVQTRKTVRSGSQSIPLSLCGVSYLHCLLTTYFVQTNTGNGNGSIGTMGNRPYGGNMSDNGITPYPTMPREEEILNLIKTARANARLKQVPVTLVVTLQPSGLVQVFETIQKRLQK